MNKLTLAAVMLTILVITAPSQAVDDEARFQVLLEDLQNSSFERANKATAGTETTKELLKIATFCPLIGVWNIASSTILMDEAKYAESRYRFGTPKKRFARFVGHAHKANICLGLATVLAGLAAAPASLVSGAYTLYQGQKSAKATSEISKLLQERADARQQKTS